MIHEEESGTSFEEVVAILIFYTEPCEIDMWEWEFRLFFEFRVAITHDEEIILSLEAKCHKDSIFILYRIDSVESELYREHLFRSIDREQCRT